ncbi:MAG: hypothetical protein AAB539_01840 [Patescibacteria group bacterium]
MSTENYVTLHSLTNAALLHASLRGVLLQDDEAIQQKYWIAALPLNELGVARNDGCEGLRFFMAF